MPLRAGHHSLAAMGGPVLPQMGNQGQRQGEDALAAPGLGLLVDQPGAADPVDAAAR